MTTEAGIAAAFAALAAWLFANWRAARGESRRLGAELAEARRELRTAGERLLIALTSGPAQVAQTLVPEQSDDPPRILDDAAEAEIERASRIHRERQRRDE